MSNKDRVFIFDTTMRDGEQSPGASMSLEEKIQIARVFDELGIDIIEAGFPIASPGDFEAVSEVSKINIWACILTSKAEVGSSQTKSLGCVASALAIDILCLCPPENSCGYRSADF